MAADSSPPPVIGPEWPLRLATRSKKDEREDPRWRRLDGKHIPMNEDRLVSEEVRFMRRLLGSWLADSDWRTEDLLHWLQGYGLPATRSDEDSHVWLLRGLPLTGDRPAAKAELARRVAVLLREKPDVRKPGRHPEEVLYNLLMLAAGLSLPEVLAEPLYESYQRSELEGKYLGLDLKDALRAALVENQIDNRLEAEWFAQLESQSTAKLSGNPYKGFAGVLLMPETPELQDRPYMDAIGRALKLIAQHLENESDRRPQFRRLLDKVGKTYGYPPSLGYDLVLQANLREWPGWSVECLPELFFEIEGSGDQATLLARLALRRYGGFGVAK